MSERRYRIKPTGYSSAKFGVCEVCRQPAAEVFIQVEEVQRQREYGRWYWAYGEDLFGHEACLLKARKAA